MAAVALELGTVELQSGAVQSGVAHTCTVTAVQDTPRAAGGVAPTWKRNTGDAASGNTAAKWPEGSQFIVTFAGVRIGAQAAGAEKATKRIRAWQAAPIAHRKEKLFR